MDKELPEITKRIKNLIDEKFNGNVRKFCLSLGFVNSSKINRLFLIDKRNGEYPIPSTDIILSISKAFDISTDWLFNGTLRRDNTNVNNITIDNKKISGDGNITNSNDIEVKANDDYISIIKQQQEQINKLMELLSNVTIK